MRVDDRWRREHENFRDQFRGGSHVDLLEIGDELQRAAASLAGEAVPNVAIEIDDELAIALAAAAVDRTTAGEAVLGALEPGVEMVVCENARDRDGPVGMLQIDEWFPRH